MATDGDNQTPTRRRGRPAKSEARDDTRAAIIAAAAAAFARDGFDATSMRGVAREASVDPALVRHYFTDKAALFAESVSNPMSAERLLARALDGPADKVGENLVRHIVTTFDEPGAADRTVRLVHTAIGQEFAATSFRDLVMSTILTRIAEHINEQDAERRAAFACSQLMGLILTRYAVPIEPIASAPADEVVAWVGPVVQWHLDGAPGSPTAP